MSTQWNTVANLIKYTYGTERGLFNNRQTAIVYGEMTDIQTEKYETGKFAEVVVS